MTLRNLFTLCCLLTLATYAYARSVQSVQSVQSGFFERNSDDDLVAVASKNRQTIQNNQQGRVFPNPIVAKKLLLLKFKKIIPISLLLLRSENGGEAELVPVYQSSLIPSNVEFISTPGGLNGHEDVQAIAIPSDLANKNDIAEALQVVATSTEPQIVKAPAEEDEPLEVNEDDDQQVLVEAAKPSALRSTPAKAKVNSPFEETSLYLFPYQENRGNKQSRRKLYRSHN